jgi:hypothetical protein
MAKWSRKNMEQQKYVAFTNPFKARIRKLKHGWVAFAPYGGPGTGKGVTGVLLGEGLKSREHALALVEAYYRLKETMRHV